METLKVMMVGPRGVGKTSLLASMYDNLQGEFLNTGCKLNAVGSTSAILQERLTELRGLPDVFRPAKGAGIKGDNAVREYEFSIGPTKGEASMKLVFADVPGRYYQSDASSSEQEEVNRHLSDSVASIIAIDAPAMMELDGKYHDLINRPKQIRDKYKDALGGNSDGARLVILSPVRCEEYLIGSNNRSRELLSTVLKSYSGLLDVFQQDEYKRRIAVVIAPVQTVGCLKFNSFDEEGNAKFRKTTHRAEFSPVDCEQPLRYILRFLLDLHASYLEQHTAMLPAILPDFIKELIKSMADTWLKSLPIPKWFDQQLASLLANDKHLQKAIDEVSRNLKREGDGYHIVQGGEFFSKRQ